jgi:hypothetical protein
VFGPQLNDLIDRRMHRLDAVEEFVEALERDMREGQAVVTDSDQLYLKLAYAKHFRGRFTEQSIVHVDGARHAWYRKFLGWSEDVSPAAWWARESSRVDAPPMVFLDPLGPPRSRDAGWVDLKPSALGENLLRYARDVSLADQTVWSRYLLWMIVENLLNSPDRSSSFEIAKRLGHLEQQTRRQRVEAGFAWPPLERGSVVGPWSSLFESRGE